MRLGEEMTQEFKYNLDYVSSEAFCGYSYHTIGVSSVRSQSIAGTSVI